MKSICLLGILSLFMIGCAKETRTLVFVKPDGCDSVNFSYANDIQPLIATRCSGSTCHSAGNSNYDYSNYAILADRIRSGRLEERLLLPLEEPLHMPAGSNLSNCDLFKLRSWIHQGFPDN